MLVGCYYYYSTPPTLSSYVTATLISLVLLDLFLSDFTGLSKHFKLGMHNIIGTFLASVDIGLKMNYQISARTLISANIIT